MPAALARLRRSCRIAIISNTDDDLIADAADALGRLGAPVDRVITAEQARAYKPAQRMFDYAMRALGCAETELRHVAQGFRYDIVPAHERGWRPVWINRRGQAGDPAYGPYD